MRIAIMAAVGAGMGTWWVLDWMGLPEPFIVWVGVIVGLLSFGFLWWLLVER